MFNLDAAITNWRRQMAAGGIKSPAVLDELESHLREDVEQQMKSGSSAHQAFEAAGERIGQASALNSEFVKVGETPKARQQKFMRICCIVPAAFVALVGFSHSLTSEMSLQERVLEFATVALVVLYLCSLPAFFWFLPVVHDKRRRMTIQTAGTLIWLSCGAFILASLNFNQIAVALWAMIFVMAVLVWVPDIVDYDAGAPSPPGGGGSQPPGAGGPFQPIPACPIPGPRPFTPEVGSSLQDVGRRFALTFIPS